MTKLLGFIETTTAIHENPHNPNQAVKTNTLDTGGSSPRFSVHAETDFLGTMTLQLDNLDTIDSTIAERIKLVGDRWTLKAIADAIIDQYNKPTEKDGTTHASGGHFFLT